MEDEENSALYDQNGFLKYTLIIEKPVSLEKLFLISNRKSLLNYIFP